MTTPSFELQAQLDASSAPPITISVNSSAVDVKSWVYQTIRRHQPSLEEAEAWALVKNVKGTGDIVLFYTKEDWEKDIPGWGATLYISVQNSQKYVVSENQAIIKSVTNSFRWIQSSDLLWSFRHYYSLCLEAAGSFSLLKRKTYEQQKSWGSSLLSRRLDSESYKQWGSVDGLTGVSHGPNSLGLDEEGWTNKAGGKTSLVFLGEHNRSLKRLPFHHDVD